MAGKEIAEQGSREIMSEQDGGKIYHAPPGSSIFDVCKEIVKAAQESHSNLTMCFNGTLVSVSPDMTSSAVYTKWSDERDDYKENLDEDHPALCPHCK